MAKFFIQTRGIESWQERLVRPELQWKDGYSAKELAISWENAQDFPDVVKKVFADSKLPVFKGLSFCFGFPEYQVKLPPPDGHPSQSDVFVLAKNKNNEFISIACEGVVAETFDKITSKWLDTDGKKERLEYLQKCLEIENSDVSKIRYQLLHRTASAIIEAKRLKIPIAVMLVHSFCDKDTGFEDYREFLKLLGAGDSAKINQVVPAGKKGADGIKLYFAWVKDSKTSATGSKR